MKRQINVQKEWTRGVSRREFLRLMELAGVSMAVSGSGLASVCQGEEQPSPAEAKEVRTRCGICGLDCGMKVRIKDNRVLAVSPWKEDPKSQGFLCEMGRATPEIVNSQERILNPKKRVKDKWVDISWEEALGTISGKLKTLAKDPGPESLVVHYGVSQVRTPFYRYFLRRFANVFGTPNFTGCGSQCHVGRVLAKAHSTGWLIPDYAHTKCMVMWGTNPAVSSRIEWIQEILPAKKRGAKLICIDPRTTAIAAKADIHLRPRPGTDGALALSMAHVILKKKLHNASFIKTYETGFETYQTLVEKYPPRVAEDITGIAAKDIEIAATLFAENAPACIVPGNALELQINGVQNIRAIMLLHALISSIDVKGGGLMGGPKTKLKDLQLMERFSGLPDGITKDSYPVLYGNSKMITANKVPEAILSEKPYPIKAMIVVGGNPMLTGPNAAHMKAAYEKLDLLVVMDLFMTETAKMADIVLPSTTFFEADNFKATDRVVMTPAVIPARGNAWPTWKFWSELGSAMGYKKEFPWKTLDEAVDAHLAPLGITAAGLRQDFNGRPYEAPVEYEKYKKTGFHTPSGKIEFSSKALADVGYDPLPVFKDPVKDSGVNISGNPYPLIMTAGARIPMYYHSQFRNIASLKKKFPEALLEMNRADAWKLAIASGAPVKIISPRGNIQARAIIVPGLPKGTVAMSHGWHEASVNVLTDDQALDPVSGFPGFRGFLCRVEKVKKVEIVKGGTNG